MFLRNCSLYLVLFLLVSAATAARKTKRPVKPAKTFPRTNVTPSPQVAAVSAAAASTTTTTTATPSAIRNSADVSVEEAILPAASASGAMDDSELPKPLSSSTLIETGGTGIGTGIGADAKTDKPEASSGGTSAPAQPLGLAEEDCDPDMIGFEIITG